MFDLALQILAILAPAAILAVIGLVWAKANADFPINFVTNLVTNIGMPALLFYTLTSGTVELSALGTMLVASFVVHLIAIPLAVILLRRANKDWRLCIAMVLGNTGNLGLPVCYFAYGDIGLAYGMAFFSFQCVLLFSIGEAVLSGSRSIVPALKSPILHSLWLAALVNYFGIDLPKVVVDTTELLGQFVIPLMLITLGVSLAGLKIDRLPSTLLWSLIRTLLLFFVGFAVAAMLNLDGVARGVLILEIAMPVAVYNFLLAVRHNRDSVEISGLILVTHLASIVYLPFVLAYLLA